VPKTFGKDIEKSSRNS